MRRNASTTYPVINAISAGEMPGPDRVAFFAGRFQLLIPAVICVCLASCSRDTSENLPTASIRPDRAGQIDDLTRVTGGDDPVMPQRTSRLPQFSDIQDDPNSFSTRPAEAWTRLFQRNSDWSGADGIYSMPVSGVQTPGSADQTSTLFTFGDTLIGNVDRKTLRRAKTRMVHFSDALLAGNAPHAERTTFGYAGSRPEFVPMRAQVAPFEDKKFWLQDGLILNGHYYTQAMVIQKLSPDYPWWTRGTILIKAPLKANGPDWSSATQVAAPHRHLEQQDALVYFGVACLEMTEASGWPNPDGFIYLYGRYEKALRPFNPWEQRIELAVARVRPEHFEDFSQWKYWSGTTWSPEITDVAPLGLGGPELSVSPITSGRHAGKFLLVSKHVRTDLYYRIGDTPSGPFGTPYRFHATTDESEYGYPAYTYNAKAHPHLSSHNSLLVSYNVNCQDRCLTNGDIYRPRFIWLDLKPNAGEKRPRAE